MLLSGVWFIIATFHLIKNEKISQPHDQKYFWYHEIWPPDPQSCLGSSPPHHRLKKLLKSIAIFKCLSTECTRPNNKINLNKLEYYLALGVSICLDLDTGKKLVLTLEKILTLSKSQSRQLRNLGRDQDFSILSRWPHPIQYFSSEIKTFVIFCRFLDCFSISIKK